MSKKIDITVKEKDKKKRDELLSSYLEIEFSGKDMNETIANAIRRVTYDDIPTYAFCKELINIEANTSIFDNDKMRLRLSNIPIYDVNNNIDFLEAKYWKSVDYKDPQREKHPDEKLIEMYINVHNNTPEKMNVMTNNPEIKYLVDGEIKETPYGNKYPVLIIQLKPNQSFKAHLKAGLGVGERNNLWSASCNTFYDYDTPDKIIFRIESQGQLTEQNILVKSCRYLIHKLELIKKTIKDKNDRNEFGDDNLIKIILDDEDQTIGYLLNRKFQDHPKINFSSITKPDLLLKSITFTIQSEDKSPIKYVIEQIDEVINIFIHLEKEFNKLK